MTEKSKIKIKNPLLKDIIRFLMRMIFRISIEGRENVPPQGGIIVATNHLSRWDIPLLLLIPGRKDLTALVTDKYLEYPFIRWFIEAAGGIWIDRTRADFTAFRKAIEALEAGQSLGIAPEGTRSDKDGLLEGKPGTVLLAVKAQVPVVPVALTGTEVVARNWWRRPRLIMRFGKPFVLPPLTRENRDAGLQTSTDEMMCRIAALLPEEYRGFYRHHPRLKELLENTD
jgi:1-acyl-sn-glycerol-3-phosphate acyltransferase